jgi:hypothetical protein
VVQQVRVGQHPVGGPPDRIALGLRGVAVQRRRPDLGEPEAAERAELVVGQRLRRSQVERGRLVVREELVEDRELVAEALARRRAGRDDEVLAGACTCPRVGLVRPQLGDPEVFEPTSQGGGEVVGERDRVGGPRR